MAVTQIRGGVSEGLRVGDGSARRDRPLFPVLQQRATAPESWLPDAGSDPPGGVTFMNGATKRRSAFLESGALAPNPWDLTLLGRNVWRTVEGTRTEDRAPQGCDPSAGSRAGMARGGFDAEAAPKLQTRRRRILAYCGRKMGLPMGSTLAVTTDVKNVATLVHDLDNSVASRELVSRFVNSGYFSVVEYTDSEDRIRELMDRGKAGAVLRMNKGFEDDLRAGRTSQLQVIVDGTDSNTAGIVLNYSSKIAGQFSTELLTQRILRSSGPLGQTGRVVVETRAWFNENLESRNFYVPGVIAIIVMLITLMLTSMAVVREKEIGTMEQIMVTPITSAEFILGKTVPFALIGFADVILITLIGVFWFEVPIRGNLALLLVATALYLLTTLSIGLFISTVSQTQQQAMMSTFFFYLPAVLLSGFMFPIANMPPL